jgi:hypothetical protein
MSNPYEILEPTCISFSGWLLPALPEPKEVLLYDEAVCVKGFTKSQMIEYAIAALNTEKARSSK